MVHQMLLLPKRIFKRSVLAALSACFLAVCVPFLRAQTSNAEDRLTLERVGCYGSCPSYSITVLRGGDVTWKGRDFVRVKGTARSRISKASADRLFRDANAANFFVLEDGYYGNCVTDGPDEYISYKHGGRLKRINTYCDAPAQLYQLEKEIDRKTESIQWIFINGPTLEKLLSRGSLTMAKNGTAYMKDAILWGRGDVIRVLVKHGFNVDGPNSDNETYLMDAVRLNKNEAAKALLEAGANPTARERMGETPAINAGYRGAEMIRLFLDRHVPIDDSDDRGWTMLMAAASQARLDAVEVVLQAGANINARNAEGKTAIGVAEEYRDKYYKGLAKELNQIIDYLQEHGGVR